MDDAAKNPYESPQTEGSFQFEPARSADVPYLKAWAVFFLAATILGGIAGAVAGAIIGGVLGANGQPMQTIVLSGQIAGFVVSLPISFLIFRWAVERFIVRPLLTNR